MEDREKEVSSFQPNFDVLFYHNPLPMWIYEVNTYKFLQVNEAAIKKYGYTKEEFLSLTVKDIFPKEDNESLRNLLKNLTPSITNRQESIHLLKSGERIHVEITAFSIKYKELDSCLVQVHDVSERIKEIEVNKTITDNATAALFMMNAKSYCTFMNPAAEEMFGYTFEEISKQPLHYLIHHHRPDGSFYPIEECPLDRALLENNEMRAHEDVFFRKDGSSFPVLCAASPVFENGVPVSTVIEVRDITAQKESEESIKQKAINLEIINSVGQSISENLNLQTILQNVTDATTKLSKADFGAFFYNTLNEEGEAMMLYTLSGAPKEAFDKFGMPRNTSIFHPTFSQALVLRIDNVKKDPRYGKNPPHYGMPSGHLPVISYMSVPVVSRSAGVIGCLLFGHRQEAVFTEEAERMVVGIAAQAAIAIEHAKLYEEVKKLNAKKDEFISVASHELKTPLTSLSASLQLINRIYKNDPLSKQLPSLFNTSTISLKKLNNLIKDLLNVTKIEEGQLSLNKSLFNISTVIRECCQHIRLAGTHELVLEGDLDLEVYADPIRIDQVVVNFVNNAVKYSPNSNKVVIKIERLNDMLKVSVTDTGVGIPPEKIPFLFDRYYRVDKTGFQFSGLGLGLYISAEIIRKHGGEIGVESTLNKGSTFWFTIPVGLDGE